MAKRLPLSLSLLFLFSLALDAKSLLYKAVSHNSTVYILGSIHLAKPDFYPLDKAIEEAYRGSDTLVVELDPESRRAAEVMQRTMATLGYYPQGKSLRSELSPQTYRALQAYTEKSGLRLEELERMRPWVVMLQLTMTEMLRLGYSPELGIDKHFIAQAKRDRKAVLELETIEEQLTLLSRDDRSYQERLLRYSLSTMHEIEPMLEELAVRWQKGDGEAMERMFLLSLQDDADLKEVYEDLVIKRNNRMTQKIVSYLRTGRVYFVVVGAGHVIGDEGIAALLKKQGYEITQQ